MWINKKYDEKRVRKSLAQTMPSIFPRIRVGSFPVSQLFASGGQNIGPTLSNPMDCSLPGSSVRGIFQARGLEWGAIAFSGLIHQGDAYSDRGHTVSSTLSSLSVKALVCSSLIFHCLTQCLDKGRH